MNSTRLNKLIWFVLVVGAALLVTPASRAAQDACSVTAHAAIDAARDYQKAVRDVRSVCAHTPADCSTAETGADSALDAETNAHSAMISACGDVIPPPPPPSSPTLAGDIVINEIMANPAGEEDENQTFALYNAEWIELYNPTETDFDLQGVTIVIDDPNQYNNTFQIQSSLVIPAHGFVVIGQTQDSLLNEGTPVDYVAAFAMSTGYYLPSGMNAFLPHVRVNNGTTVLDDVDLTPLGNAGSWGYSLQLSSGFADATSNDNLANWCWSTTPYSSALVVGTNFGTPDAQNTLCN